MTRQRPLSLTLAHHLQPIHTAPIQLRSYGDDKAAISIYQQIGLHLNVQHIAYQRTRPCHVHLGADCHTHCMIINTVKNL